jgi:hypothetical protein
MGMCYRRDFDPQYLSSSATLFLSLMNGINALFRKTGIIASLATDELCMGGTDACCMHGMGCCCMRCFGCVLCLQTSKFKKIEVLDFSREVKNPENDPVGVDLLQKNLLYL